MPIPVMCSACEYDFKVDDTHAGKLIRCPSCKEAVRVRSPQRAAARPRKQGSRKSANEAAAAPRRKRKSSKSSKQQRKSSVSAFPKGVIIGASVLGGALLAGVVGFVMMGPGNPEPDVAQSDQPATDASTEGSTDTAPDFPDAARNEPTTGGEPAASVASNLTVNTAASTAMPTDTDTSVASTLPVKPVTPGMATASPANTEPTPPTTKMSWADLNELVEPSVVKVNVKSTEGASNGSGFVADVSGLAVTNYHVVEGASEVVLAFANGDEIPVTGYAHLDPKRDIAVVVFDPARAKTTLQALPISLELPRKGEEVAAFGAPYGLDFTFTQSNVSAIRSADDLKQMIGLPNGEGTWIQHSAPISPGNSGGPLVNQDGEVVAINTLTLTIGQNLNFAISSGDIHDAVSKKLPTALPVVAASAPPVDRGGRRSGGRDSGAINPFERRRKEAIDLTSDERGAKLMARMKDVSILMLAFTLDRSGTVTGAFRRGAREAVERSKLKSRSFAPDAPVLLVAMALEPNGSKSSLRATSSLLMIDPDNGDMLKLWEETDDVGTISSQSLMLGRLPPNLRRDITSYFGKFRSAMSKARRAHPPVE